MVQTFASGDVLEHPQLNNMVSALAGDGVIDGMAVSERGILANMSVDVASGNCYIGGTKYTEASTVNLSIDASHATLHRKDLITYDPTTSHPVVTKGTNSAGGTSAPVYPPNIPAGDILLAIVYIGATFNTIDDADITDGQILVEAAHIIHKCVASDVLRDSEDAITDISQTAYTKELEITVPAGIISGTLRIAFAINETSSGTAYGRIYRNGVAVGSAESSTAATYTTYSEDISGWQEDDTIELWAYNINGSGNGNVKEFRVYCDYDIITIVSSVGW